MKLHGSYIQEQSFTDQQRLLEGREPQVILDVGGNIGNTVELYAKIFPGSVIYTFEPFPDAFNQLAARFSENPQVRPTQAAVSSEQGSSTFYVNDYADTNSLFPRPVDARRYYAVDNKPVRTITVPTVALDDFAFRHGITQIGILKMDIQGGEGRALAGARGLLTAHSVDIIFSEVLFVPHYEGAAPYHEITSFLSGFGYTLYNLYNLSWGTNGQLRFADALYVSPEIRRTVVDAMLQEP